jgi:hypothetical protein
MSRYARYRVTMLNVLSSDPREVDINSFMLCKARQGWRSNQTTVTDTKMIEVTKGFHMQYGVIAVESSTEVSSFVMQAFVLLAFTNFVFLSSPTCYRSRSQWLRGLRHELSSLARKLGSCVRIPLEAWMSVCVYFMFVLFCM